MSIFGILLIAFIAFISYEEPLTIDSIPHAGDPSMLRLIRIGLRRQAARVYSVLYGILAVLLGTTVGTIKVLTELTGFFGDGLKILITTCVSVVLRVCSSVKGATSWIFWSTTERFCNATPDFTELCQFLQDYQSPRDISSYL